MCLKVEQNHVKVPKISLKWKEWSFEDEMRNDVMTIILKIILSISVCCSLTDGGRISPFRRHTLPKSSRVSMATSALTSLTSTSPKKENASNNNLVLPFDGDMFNKVWFLILFSNKILILLKKNFFLVCPTWLSLFFPMK